MNLPLFIARKYFLSGRKKNFINTISIISMLVVGAATMTLIVVLSVFNGLEGLLRGLYGGFDPQIVISARESKSFQYTSELEDKIIKTPGVQIASEVIEDNVLIRYKNAQRVVRMKGVSADFMDQGRINSSITSGSHHLDKDGIKYAIVGRGVKYDLSINPANDFYTLQMYYPNEIKPGVVNPERVYNVKHILPGGIFAIEKYYDENYVFVPLEFASSLLNYEQKRTAIEVLLQPETDEEQVKQALIQRLGADYQVKLGEELHEDLYKILSIEKLFVFIIFTMIIAIASINLYFALSMLAIDKSRDIAILMTQGATKTLIAKIFLFEGAIIALGGAITGLVLGLLITYVQQQFGLISMGMATAIIDAYPVKIEWLDVLLTCISIVVITFFASFQPARLATRNIDMKGL
ncbi:MAG: ABC transporter permease [Cyclobacteriaceae bacterium]|nr:ABC transporter permease [Cyclobacteriaceae bacterium HetDA_MAG_MS6]